MKQRIDLARDVVDIRDYQYNEAMKTLRTNIQFSGQHISVVMLTSTVPNEGKSSTALQLVKSIGQTGKKVLMIDADIRKSVLSSRYKIGQRVDGLSQYLSGMRNIEDVVYETNVENVDLVLAGPFSPNPAELLEEQAFDDLITWARDHYDYVIIDTPPMANVIDGAIVARCCDGAIIVCEAGGVSHNMIKKVKNQLETTGIRILGVILNKVDTRAGGYYYYGKYSKYGKYGKYGRYGKYEKYVSYGSYGAYDEDEK